jgi:hypothetical protein
VFPVDLSARLVWQQVLKSDVADDLALQRKKFPLAEPPNALLALTLLPAHRNDIDAMLHKLKVAKLLRGYRGRPVCDVEALVRAICGLSEFFLDHRHAIADIEINPLVILQTGVRAVDVRVIPNGAQ